MLRKSQFGAFGPIMPAAALAAVVVSAALASSACAVGGPMWVVKGAEMSLETEKEALESEGGVYTLTGTTTVECEAVKGTGEIIGGNPGRDLSTLTFEKCHVHNKPNCLAASTGFEDSIQSTAKSVLVYPHEKAESTAEALDALTPDNGNSSENLFVEFTLKNASGSTECSLLNGIKADVIATGTLIADPSQINKKCGLLTHAGTLVSGAFSVTAALEENLVGALNATGVSEEATLWEPAKTTFSSITCKLEAFGPAGETGVSDVLLVSKAIFGWNK
jgi:hypothetical protein